MIRWVQNRNVRRPNNNGGLLVVINSKQGGWTCDEIGDVQMKEIGFLTCKENWNSNSKKKWAYKIYDD